MIKGVVWFFTSIISISYIASIFNARWAALIITFLYYLRPEEKATYPYPIVMVGLLIGFIILLLHKKPYSFVKNHNRTDTKLFLLMQVYLLFNILLLNRWNIQEIYISYIIPAVLIFLIITEYIITIKQIRLTLLAIGIPALLISSDALYIHYFKTSDSQIWSLYHLVDSDGGARLRSLGWWDNSNKLAYLSNIGMLCFYVVYITSKNIKRYLFLLPATVFLPTIFLTGSRSALLQITVSAFILFIRGKRNISTYIFIVASIFIIMSYLTVLSPDRRHAEGSKEERIEILFHAKEAFISHPVLGVGFKTFRDYNPLGLVTHNTFAQLFAELGLIGVFLFFLMVKKMFMGAYMIGNTNKNNNEIDDIRILSNGIFAISVGAFIYYFFGNQLLDFMFCTIIALLVSIKRANEYSIENKM